MKCNIEYIDQASYSFLIRVRGSDGVYPSSHLERGLNSGQVTGPSQDRHTPFTLKSNQSEAQNNSCFWTGVVYIHVCMLHVASEKQSQCDTRVS